MNKVHREKAAKSFAAYGQEFAPKLIQEDDDFFIMDWKDKNGSGNMATRYIVDKAHGTLIITGDSGNCIATWHSRKKPEEIARYLNDEQYFIEKMQCTEYKYDYDWDNVEADLKDLEEEYLGYVREGGFMDNYGKEITEEDCVEDFEEMRSLLGEIRLAEESNYPEDLIDLFEKYNTDWWESSFSDLGRRVSFRIYQWIYGFQMGLEILKNKDEEEKTREESVLQLYEIAGIRTVEIRKIRKALKQKTCDDCISRAEAIKETKALLRGNYDSEYIIETLKMLPPVTSKALEQQPCEDCISRKEMLKYQEYLHGKMSNEENHKLWEFIKQLPSAQPTRPTSRWSRQTDTYHDYYECENCGIGVGLDDVRNFCPNCGADMRESEDNECR